MFLFWFSFLVADIADVDVILWDVLMVVILIHVRRGDGQHGAVGTEGQGGYAGGVPETMTGRTVLVVMATLNSQLMSNLRITDKMS